MNPRFLVLPIAISLVLGTATVNAQEPPAAAPAASPGASPGLDFGDFKSSTITGKAWTALNAKNYTEAEAYAQKCIDTFKTQAVEMQKGLTAPVSGDKEAVHQKWALNDVGTCYFILGKALEDSGKPKDAIPAYKFLVDNLSFAQCWDPKGWFWKPADAARERLKALEFDALK